jgi:hypothetical protein
MFDNPGMQVVSTFRCLWRLLCARFGCGVPFPFPFPSDLEQSTVTSGTNQQAKQALSSRDERGIRMRAMMTRRMVCAGGKEADSRLGCALVELAKRGVRTATTHVHQRTRKHVLSVTQRVRSMTCLSAGPQFAAPSPCPPAFSVHCGGCGPVQGGSCFAAIRQRTARTGRQPSHASVHARLGMFSVVWSLPSPPSLSPPHC